MTQYRLTRQCHVLYLLDIFPHLSYNTITRLKPSVLVLRYYSYNQHRLPLAEWEMAFKVIFADERSLVICLVEIFS
jgi:hypothetical protein